MLGHDHPVGIGVQHSYYIPLDSVCRVTGRRVMHLLSSKLYFDEICSIVAAQLVVNTYCEVKINWRSGA